MDTQVLKSSAEAAKKAAQQKYNEEKQEVMDTLNSVTENVVENAAKAGEFIAKKVK